MPLRAKIVTLRPAFPWFKSEINVCNLEKRKRRKLRGAGVPLVWNMLISTKTVNDLIHQSKMAYFSNLVADHQSDPTNLFFNSWQVFTFIG